MVGRYYYLNYALITAGNTDGWPRTSVSKKIPQKYFVFSPNFFYGFQKLFTPLNFQLIRYKQ